MQWRRQAWGTGARAPLEFANARKFCRPNARWLSLLDDFVTTNFGTRAPPLEQNSGDATAYVLFHIIGQLSEPTASISPKLDQ